MDEVPGAMHLITAKELARFTYADPLRTLRTVSGVNLQEEDGYGLRPNIGMRGSGVERSARITLMEDGVLIAPAPYTASAAYYFPSIARMASVEVLKGSSQIAHGPQTAGGAINLVTPELPDSGATAKLRLEAGAWGHTVRHAQAGARVGAFSVWAEALEFGSDGFKSLPGGQPTGFDKADQVLKVRWQRGDHSLQAKLTRSEELSHETYLGLTAPDFAADPFARYAGSQVDQMTSEHSQKVLTHRFARGNWSLTTDVYRTDFHRNWYKLDKVVESTGVVHGIIGALESKDALAVLNGDPSGELLVKANNRTYFAHGLQHRGVLRLPKRQKLIYGLRLHADGVDRFQWSDTYAFVDGTMGLQAAGTPGSAGNRVDGAEALAGFVRATLRAGDVTFTPGVRHESMVFSRTEFGGDFDRSEPGEVRTNAVSVWLPGVGVHWAATPELSAFAGLHRGFIPPGSAPGTRPETSWNSELGARWSFQRISGALTYFENAYTDLLGADLLAAGGGGTGDLFNGGAARTRGVEVEAVANLISSPHASLPVRVAYTWTDAQFTTAFASDFDGWGDVDSGDELPYLAPHMFSLVTSYERATWAVDVSTRYTAAMRTVAGQGDLLPDRTIPAATVVDAGLRWFPHEHVLMSAGVNNLLDATYAVATRPAGWRPGMPRSLRLGLTFSI
jgi:Fe(3+) dicitrate transport protein